jgi:type IV pilus assembly protein PilC
MASFAYVAKSDSGEEHSGLLAATSVDEVVSRLHDRGLTVLRVVEARPRSGLRTGQAWWRSPIGHVGTRELALLTRQLATVLEAGIPLVRGLRGLASDSTGRGLRRAVVDVADRIERGSSLSDAMQDHPEAFGPLFVSMMRAGERAGTLDQILDQLAIYLEKMDAIQTKVRSALSYPVFVLVFAITSTLFMLLKIVPTFQQIYTELGQALPVFTRIVIAMSQAVRDNLLLSLGLSAALIFSLLVASRTRSGRYLIDSFLLNLPLFGPIIRKSVMARFARTSGILLRSGLPILESLELVQSSVGNAVVARAVEKARTRIGAGQGVTASFRAAGAFPEMILQLMATGEESGEMDAMLLKAADFYDRQVEAAMHGLTSLIEPVMIVLVGAMIGVIVVSMFLPIFNLGDALMKGGYNY